MHPFLRKVFSGCTHFGCTWEIWKQSPQIPQQQQQQQQQEEQHVPLPDLSAAPQIKKSPSSSFSKKNPPSSTTPVRNKGRGATVSRAPTKKKDTPPQKFFFGYVVHLRPNFKRPSSSSSVPCCTRAFDSMIIHKTKKFFGISRLILLQSLHQPKIYQTF